MSKNKPDVRETRRKPQLTLKEKRAAKKAKRQRANGALAKA